MPNNEHTKMQIRNFLDEAVRKAQNPDPREKLKREREKKAKKVSKDFGF